jgi:hypothetical protein
LARARKAVPSGKTLRPFIAVAILLVIAVTAYFLLSYTPVQAKAVMDYQVQISIQVENNNSTKVRFIVPPMIGKGGGAWASHALDKYGVDNNYPVYTETPPANYPGYSIIHVRSNTVYNFTLGDFFAVWGYPLGPDKTLTLTSNPPDGAIWFMCVGPSSNALRPGHWGAETLTSDNPIILIYGKTGCL